MAGLQLLGRRQSHPALVIRFEGIVIRACVIHFLRSRLGSVTDMYSDLSVCPLCDSQIGAGETVVRSRVSRGITYRPPVREVAWEPICVRCARRGSFVVNEVTQEPAWKGARARHHYPDGEVCVCVTCGRSVILKPDPRRAVPTCSTVCRSKHYNQDAVRVPTSHECEGCGDEFEGRTDARYCSSACRQRAYRTRTADSPTQ